MADEACRYVLCLLSGGGRWVRHLIQAVVLDGLESSLTFDLTVGVGGGGALAVWGAVKEGPQQKYADLFRPASVRAVCDRSIVSSELSLSPTFDGVGKRLMFRQQMEGKPLRGRVVVPLYNLSRHRVEIWSSDHSSSPAAWEVADASTSALTRFPAVRLGSDSHVDGTVGCLDPVMLAYSEARRLFGDACPIRLLVLSCGKSTFTEVKADWGSIPWLSGGLLDLGVEGPTESMVHHAAWMIHRESLHNRLLYLNGPIPIQDDRDGPTEETLTQLQMVGHGWLAQHRTDLADFGNPHSCRSWSRPCLTRCVCSEAERGSQ